MLLLGRLQAVSTSRPGLGPCDSPTWSRPLRPRSTLGAPQQPRLVAPASLMSRPEAAGGWQCPYLRRTPGGGGVLTVATGTLGPGLSLRSDPHVRAEVAWLSAGQRLDSGWGCSLICKRLPVCKASGGGGCGNSGTCETSGSQGPLTLPPKLPHQSLLCPSSLSLFSFEKKHRVVGCSRIYTGE